MRRAVLALAAALPAVASAEEPPPESLVFVEVDAPERAVHAGEAVRVVLRVGFDREGFARHAAPLFRRPTDVPLHVGAPWLDALPGATPLPTREGSDDARERVRIAANDRVLDAVRVGDRRVDGRAFTVLEVDRTYLPGAAGDLVLAGPRVRFSFATRFEEDFVGGRVAADPRDVVVEGAGRTLLVVPLPEEGRPPGFQGAVGTYDARASVDRASARVGETFRLTLVVEGEGNLSALDTPRIDVPGFHVYGAIDDRGSRRRTVVYDVAPLRAGSDGLPAIPFAFFVPGPSAAYRVVRTEPIPLEVAPAEGVVAAAPPRAETPAPSRGTATYVLLGFGAALVAFAAFLTFRRRRPRAQAPVDPGSTRTARAAAALRSSVARGGSDVADALAECLAARLRCPPAAVVGPDLARRLVETGLGPDLAARAAEALERLTEARYGGAPVPTSEVAGVAADLDAALLPSVAREPGGPRE